MIGLDTNILVRYLTQDDPIQSPKANEIIERRLTEENPGFVSIVAMVEIVWVLERAFRLATQDIVKAVERVLQTDVLVVENEQEVFTAMIALKQRQGSFADAVIAALGGRIGCSYTLTLDRKAASGFRASLVRILASLKCRKMSSIRCRGVLFDLDGVLVDSTPAVTRVWACWARQHGFDADKVVREAHGKPSITTIRELLPDADHEAES